jgi:hypothetical protein
MTVATFNDGWRAGYRDAKRMVYPLYVDHGNGIGLVRVSDHSTGAFIPLEPRFVNYATGYIGGFSAKADAPPTGPEPVTLGTLRHQIERLRITWLLGGGDEEDATAGLDPVAEQHYLLAIGALEQAQRFATLADLHQARALGEQRSTR